MPFEKIRNNEALNCFFSQMPKEDLHHHFGSIYAEPLLQHAIKRLLPQH
jgi:hypothetical protein